MKNEHQRMTAIVLVYDLWLKAVDNKQRKNEVVMVWNI